MELPSGTVLPVFPLPNVVFFPHGVLPLHIFEPRYRQMVIDALAGNRLIAMALSVEGGEGHEEGRPAIHPVGCVGRIVHEERLPDGRWNIALVGLARVRFDELVVDKPYRMARVEVLPDAPTPADDAERARRRRQLVEQFLKVVPRRSSPLGALSKAFEDADNLGVLVDLVCSALPLPVAAKQQLLEECDLDARLEKLMAHLGRMKPAPVVVRPRGLPPISDN